MIKKIKMWFRIRKIKKQINRKRDFIY